MKKENEGKGKIIAIIICAFIIILCALVVYSYNNGEFIAIKSKGQLERIYNDKDGNEFLKKLALAPVFMIQEMPYYSIGAMGNSSTITDSVGSSDLSGIKSEISSANSTQSSSSKESSTSQSTTEVITGSTEKDYSKTNVQVEEVDEADIIKTDGNYIYSLSGSNIIITNVENEQEIKIESEISMSGMAPEELIIYDNKLVIISTTTSSGNISTYSYYSSSKNNTVVTIYDITDKGNPRKIKEYQLYESYYTARLIDSRLYVIATGYLRKENNEIITTYKEDNKEKEIGLENIKYLKNEKTKKQTLISMLDLNDTKKDVVVNSYLINLDNAYITEDSIYLLNQNYESDVPEIRNMFGLKGIFGLFDTEIDYGYKTSIYKYSILKNGEIEYHSKTKTSGKTINQFSLDEYNGNLRVALYDNNGTRVVVFDENLKEIGRTDNMAKGETMYSSRFVGEKAYLVTYKTIDPLFVIDLSNPKAPKILGELKIPGYSTYLHPYDENHIIGIGMETEEVINRNSSGKVISTTSRIVGMKMALFDVSDVNNPIEISNTVIGNSRTTSAILTNHKALLFSKEKGIIAIPVNNLKSDLQITEGTTYSSTISSYKDAISSYISEGYLVYNINTEEGFNLKGTITHETNSNKNTSSSYYSYYNISRLLRGLYIEDNLYTVSEDYIKVNKLEDLTQITELKINE